MRAISVESCPICGDTESVRPKLLLIDEIFKPKPGCDSREKYFKDMRVDELRPEAVRGEPLSQFVDGFYCDTCAKGFVSDAAIKDHANCRRRLRKT